MGGNLIDGFRPQWGGGGFRLGGEDGADVDIARARCLGGVEETAVIVFAGETVKGVPEADVDRTTAAGKASSVQFIHFPFTRAQVDKFRAPGTEVMVGFKHPAYAHLAVLPEETRAALAEDFD